MSEQPTTSSITRTGAGDAHPAPAGSIEGGRQVVHVTVSDGYHPSVLRATPGVPLRIVFERLDDHPCSDRVVFSRPHLERHLAPRSATIVDLPVLNGADVRFTCGMGRYRGRIELAAAPPGDVGMQWISTGAVLVVAVALVIFLALATASGSTASILFGGLLLLADGLALIALARRSPRHAPRRP